MNAEYCLHLEKIGEEYKIKVEQYNYCIDPLIKSLMFFDTPSKIIYNTNTKEFTKIYSPENEKAIKKINKTIKEIQDYIFKNEIKIGMFKNESIVND